MKGTDGSYELSELLSGRGGSTDAVEEEVPNALQEGAWHYKKSKNRQRHSY